VGLSLAFCFFILVLAFCLIIYIQNKSYRNDQKKILDEVSSDLEEDLLSDNQEDAMEALVDWIEK
jgi:hypothetical protein